MENAKAEIKYYNNKSNAKRAAKSQGLDMNNLELDLTAPAGMFRYVEKKRITDEIVKPEPVKTEEAEFSDVQKKAMASAQKKADKLANKQASKSRAVGGIEVTHESTIQRPCKQVWHIADSMPGAKRKDVLAACVKAGIAFFTARTQYQQWRQCLKEMAVRQNSQATQAKKED